MNTDSAPQVATLDPQTGWRAAAMSARARVVPTSHPGDVPHRSPHRRRHARQGSALAAIALAALVVGGCGGSSGTGRSVASTTAPAGPAHTFQFLGKRGDAHTLTLTVRMHTGTFDVTGKGPEITQDVIDSARRPATSVTATSVMRSTIREVKPDGTRVVAIDATATTSAPGLATPLKYSLSLVQDLSLDGTMRVRNITVDTTGLPAEMAATTKATAGRSFVQSLEQQNKELYGKTYRVGQPVVSTRSVPMDLPVGGVTRHVEFTTRTTRTYEGREGNLHRLALLIEYVPSTNDISDADVAMSGSIEDGRIVGTMVVDDDGNLVKSESSGRYSVRIAIDDRKGNTLSIVMPFNLEMSLVMNT